MKYRNRVIAAVLCLVLCLCSCAGNSAETFAPTENSEALRATYNDAKTRLEQAANLTMTASYQLAHTVGSQTYTQNSITDVSYTKRSTDAMTAIARETLKYGTYEAKYTAFYANQTAYCQTDDFTFSASMSADEFTTRQLPAALLNAALYRKIVSHNTDSNTIITFSEATGLEQWATTTENIQFISASGSATIDANGDLAETTYIADYIADGFHCHLEASVSPTVAETLDLSNQIPSTAGSIPIACYDAPRILLQAVGSIFSAQSITASSQETLVCSAAALVQSSQTNIDLFGSGSDFMAKSEYAVTVTDYTGIPSTSTLTETFRDGVYSYAVNGGTPVEPTDINAHMIRTEYEDILLSSLFTPELIQDAQLTEMEDFYYIHFAGNDTFVKALCSWIYSGIGVDLDSYASSSSTAEAFGWLSINKRTGLPTSIGQTLKRNYIIENVSYPLTYEYSQSLYLSSESAYKTITGTLQSEDKPETLATPLLYKVTGENGQQLWLLGTIHVGDARTAYLPQALYNAFHASDALAVEINMEAFEQRLETDTALQQQIAAGYYYTDGSGVTDYLDSGTYEIAKKKMLVSGNYTSAAERMKIALWENAISNFLLQQSYSLVSEKGVEQRLLALAKDTGKVVLDIESPINHTLLTTNYSASLQAYLLKDTLELSVTQYRDEITSLYNLWCQGDEAALTAAVMQDISPLTPEELILYTEHQELLVNSRNASMLEKAKAYLESDDTVFFAVGLAHILGDDGLAASLRVAGYTVEPISYSE